MLFYKLCNDINNKHSNGDYREDNNNYNNVLKSLHMILITQVFFAPKNTIKISIYQK
jgi:hypothetical protein